MNLKLYIICISFIILALISCGTLPENTQSGVTPIPATVEKGEAQAADNAQRVEEVRPTPTIILPQVTPTPEMHPLPTPEGGIDASKLVEPKTEPAEISLTTADDITLAGSYYPSAQTDAPALLLLHMLGSNRGAWDGFAQVAQNEGYAVLALDLRGHGESGGNRDYTEMDQDVDAALAWLKEQEKIDSSRIGILGASIGANLALRGGANHPEIKTVALLSPGLDYRGVTTEEAMLEYGERPALIVATQNDTGAAQSSKRLGELTQGPSELHIYSGSAHGTNLFGAGVDIQTKLLDWLAKTL